MSLCPHTQSKLDDKALLQPHTVATYESCCLELRIVNPRNEARICSRSLSRQCFSSTSHYSKLIPKRHSNNQHTIFHFFHHDRFNYSLENNWAERIEVVHWAVSGHSTSCWAPNPNTQASLQHRNSITLFAPYYLWFLESIILLIKKIYYRYQRQLKFLLYYKKHQNHYLVKLLIKMSLKKR